MRASDDVGAMIVLGRIAGVHGLHGEVVVQSFTADPAALAGYAPLLLGDTGREIAFVGFKPHKHGFLARIAGVDDRTAAEAIRGLELKVPRDRLPAPDEDEFYHADLIGLAAFHADGSPAGRVVAVHNFGAGDLLELAVPGERRTVLMAFTRATVPEIDIAGGRLVVVPPEEVEGEERR